MSEMTTAEMVEMLRTRVCGREVGDAIAARLSALDNVAKAAKELSGGLGGIAGEQDYVAPYRQVDALDAALKEAGYGE